MVSFARTLLHETAHAISNASDIRLEFENELTVLLGEIAKNSISEEK